MSPPSTTSPISKAQQSNDVTQDFKENEISFTHKKKKVVEEDYEVNENDDKKEMDVFDEKEDKDDDASQV